MERIETFEGGLQEGIGDQPQRRAGARRGKDLTSEKNEDGKHLKKLRNQWEACEKEGLERKIFAGVGVSQEGKIYEKGLKFGRGLRGFFSSIDPEMKKEKVQRRGRAGKPTQRDREVQRKKSCLISERSRGSPINLGASLSKKKNSFPQAIKRGGGKNIGKLLSKRKDENAGSVYYFRIF